MLKCFFFDRDGVLIKNYGYVHEINKLKWLKGSIEAIKFLNKCKIKVIVITNQSGIARGYFTEKELLEARECPRCSSTNCEKTMYGTDHHSFIRGYGFLDKAGAKRDMNRFKLNNDDPYGEYRVAGEVDHIDTQLKKGGKHDPKTKYFVQEKKDNGSKKDKK